MKKILCISESCCDLIFTGLPRIPSLGEEVYGKDFCIRSGGGSNTPVNLGYLGADVSYLTRIGKDDLGKYISEALENAGVKLAKNAVVDGARTAVSAVLSTSSDRCFASFMEPSSAFRKEDLEEAIQNCDIVHTFIGYANAYGIHEICQQYGKMLSLDTSYGENVEREQLNHLLSLCDYLKVNENEAQYLSGEEDVYLALLKLKEKVRKAAVITLGERGSIGLEHGKKEKINVKPYKFGDFCDACGAGDAYSAGMLYGIANNWPLKECMTYGSMTSAMAVTWAGGTDPKMKTMKGKLDL